jgi:hypothetical protein
MIPLPRVMFDTNEGSMAGGYWLSKRDLEAIGPALKQGLRVIIYMPDELEMEAILEFDYAGSSWREEGSWIGRPVPGTVKYLDGSDKDSN